MARRRRPAPRPAAPLPPPPPPPPPDFDALNRIYRDMLDRDADPAARWMWGAIGQNEAQMRAHIVQSDEFRGRQLQQLYGNILGRAADEGGLRSYLDAMRRGMSLDEVRRSIERSPEYVQSDRFLMTDPAYAAFVRAAQYEESGVMGQSQQQKDALRRQQAAQRLMYGTQRAQIADRHDRDFESRGMFRSGARLARIGEDQNVVTQQENAFNVGVADQLAGFDREAANRVADLRRRKAEEAISARSRLTQRQAEAAFA